MQRRRDAGAVGDGGWVMVRRVWVVGDGGCRCPVTVRWVRCDDDDDVDGDRCGAAMGGDGEWLVVMVVVGDGCCATDPDPWAVAMAGGCLAGGDPDDDGRCDGGRWVTMTTVRDGDGRWAGECERVGDGR